MNTFKSAVHGSVFLLAVISGLNEAQAASKPVDFDPFNNSASLAVSNPFQGRLQKSGFFGSQVLGTTGRTLDPRYGSLDSLMLSPQPHRMLGAGKMPVLVFTIKNQIHTRRTSLLVALNFLNRNGKDTGQPGTPSGPVNPVDPVTPPPSPVPLPAGVWLFISGVLGMSGLAGKKRPA